MIAAVPRTMDAMPAKITHPRTLSLSPPAYVPAVIVSALMASSLLRCRPSCESLMTVVHGGCQGGGGSNVREIAECGGRACQRDGRLPARWQATRSIDLCRALRCAFDGFLDRGQRLLERRTRLVDDDPSQDGSLGAGQAILHRALERQQVETARG